MAPLFVNLARLEGVDAPVVLVRGESGTGKELVVQALHARGPRRDAPLVAVDCTSIPQPLLPSLLFGHEAGAYTGADTTSPGLLEQAGDGILLLDEIGELGPGAQASMMRVIENRSFRRVGGLCSIPLAAAVVATTRVDLSAMAARGSFRPDLFHRLDVVRLDVPPLRERAEDIPLLAMHFQAQFARRWGRAPRGFSRGAMAAIERYPWPGNVRELKNAVEQALTLHRGGRTTLGHLPAALRHTPLPRQHVRADFQLPACGVDLAEVEEYLLAQALNRTHGNVSAAARLLHVSRSWVRHRLPLTCDWR